LDTGKSDSSPLKSARHTPVLTIGIVRFATTVALRLGHSGDCTLANAGHLPPFLNSEEMSQEPSLPLGIVADADYMNQTVRLKENDRLTLDTDGVLEATDSPSSHNLSL
jgi:hypothetical protein